MKVITYDAMKLRMDLNDYLKTNHMTLTTLADKTGVDISTLSKFKNNLHDPPERVAAKIIITMGKNLDDYRVDSVAVSIGTRWLEQITKLSTDDIRAIIDKLECHIKIREEKERRIREITNSIEELKTELKTLKDEL